MIRMEARQSEPFGAVRVCVWCKDVLKGGGGKCGSCEVGLAPCFGHEPERRREGGGKVTGKDGAERLHSER